ncbi:glycosyltransferase family 2 protein [Glaciibacter flavus]|uniref:Glycosyltransferase family 2 protein n=1 Tax=Orlajensenia flava TaxID=2565934 RepID=A0A4S4G0N6_9MICO|nr:glycosyltransferase family 2 protein [Glaciibacter flavus]THG36052.1 glycosyltransferase family 2 protein [Glaciibacter flavus]
MTDQRPARPIVAVLSVSYGSAGEIATMLDSVRDATDHPTLLAVADNLPSQAGTEDAVRVAGGGYTALPSNPGYGAAINALVRSLPTSVEWIVITNPDVVFHAGAIDAMLHEGDTQVDIAAVGPLIRDEEGATYPSARSVPSLRTGIGHALFSGVWPSNPWTARYHRIEDYDHVRDAGWLSGSCLLVRRSAFEQIGGFDEEFFMYFEDVDLGYRFGRAGWRNRFLPDAEVTHTGGHSTAGESEAMIGAHHDSAERFIQKKYAGTLLWPVRACLLLGLRVRSIFAKRRARGFVSGRSAGADRRRSRS